MTSYRNKRLDYMPHSREWAITPNGGELIVGSNRMIYWRQLENRGTETWQSNQEDAAGSTGKDSK